MGCATAPMPRQIVNSFDYGDMEYDSVWSAVVETFAELNLPIDNMEKDSGLITTDHISFLGTGNDGVCDCGGTGILIERARTGKFNVFVKNGSTGVSVRVNAQFEQTLEFDRSLSTRQCVSTGVLEARINDLIREKLTE